MAKFRNFTADLQPTGIPSARATPDAFGANVGEAVEGLGRTGQAIGGELIDHFARQDVLETHKQAAQLREKAGAQLDAWRQEGTPVNERMAEWLDNELSVFEGERSTERGRQVAQQTAAYIASDLLTVSRAHDAKLVGDAAKETATVMMRANGNRLQTMPDTLPIVVDENGSFVDNLAIPENLKPALLREMNAAAATNAVKGWAEVDPERALDQLKGGKFDPWLEPDTRDVLIGRIETDIRQEDAQRRAEIAEYARIQDIKRNEVMNKAVHDAYSEKPGERLTKGGVDKLALETFDDGTPVLAAVQVSNLYNLIETIAREGEIRTPNSTLEYLIPGIAGGTVTAKDVDEIFQQGLLSQSHYATFRGAVEGVEESALGKVRQAALSNFAGHMGLVPELARMLPDYGPAGTRVIQQALDREAEYKEAGKNPIDYYTDGTYARDTKAIAGLFSMTKLHQDLNQQFEVMKTGDVIDFSGTKLRYTGGDPYERTPSGGFMNFEMVEPEGAGK